MLITRSLVDLSGRGQATTDNRRGVTSFGHHAKSRERASERPSETPSTAGNERNSSWNIRDRPRSFAKSTLREVNGSRSFSLAFREHPVDRISCDLKIKAPNRGLTRPRRRSRAKIGLICSRSNSRFVPAPLAFPQCIYALFLPVSLSLSLPLVLPLPPCSSSSSSSSRKENRNASRRRVRHHSPL